MLVVMKAHASEEQVRAVCEKIESLGYRIWVVDHSREATRRAAYHKDVDARGLLHAYRTSERFGPWPHVLCVACGREPIER